jgi:hypothetical protein
MRKLPESKTIAPLPVLGRPYDPSRDGKYKANHDKTWRNGAADIRQLISSMRTIVRSYKEATTNAKSDVVTELTTAIAELKELRETIIRDTLNS